MNRIGTCGALPVPLKSQTSQAGGQASPQRMARAAPCHCATNGALRNLVDHRRVWTEDDIAKLKSMAGRLTLKDIAAELGRSKGATAVVASK